MFGKSQKFAQHQIADIFEIIEKIVSTKKIVAQNYTWQIKI